MSPTDDALDDPPQQGPKPFDPVKADAAAKAILAQGGQQADVDTYLQQTYGLTPHTSATAPAHDFHAEYASGRLAKRMAVENANARDQLEAETPGYGEQIAGGLTEPEARVLVDELREKLKRVDEAID